MSDAHKKIYLFHTAFRACSITNTFLSVKLLNPLVQNKEIPTLTYPKTEAGLQPLDFQSVLTKPFKTETRISFFMF